MPHLIRLICCLWLVVFSFPADCAQSAMAEKSTTVRLAATSELIPGKSYRLDLTTLILDATKSEYGSYHFEFYTNSPAASRQAILLKEGSLVNIMWGSPGTVTSKVGAIVIPVDVYRGLLGRRVCIINENNKVLFDSVTNINKLQHIRIGQGVDWPDIEIYKFNKIYPVQAPSFEGVFGMLTLNRFDCLALGVNEVDQFYRENIAQFPTIEIEKNLLLYYELPIYIYVSPQYPKLAERLKKGLQKIMENREFDRLFERYFYDRVSALNLKSRRVICLRSPYLPIDKQCKHLEQINDLDMPGVFPLR